MREPGRKKLFSSETDGVLFFTDKEDWVRAMINLYIVR